MPAPTFTPMTARRTAAPAAPASRVVKPVVKTEGAAAGLPRFAKPIQPTVQTSAKVSAVAAPIAGLQPGIEKKPVTSGTTTPASPELRSRHSPPKSTAAVSTPNAPFAPPPSASRHARMEYEAARLADRIQEPTSPVDRIQRGPLRNLKSAQGLGLSPPIQEAVEKTPLNNSLRLKIEAETGYAVGDITLVRGSAANELTSQHGTKAVTTGGVIYLHQSVATTDEEVIAHEVAHVIQQRGPSPAPDDEDAFSQADSTSHQPWSILGGLKKVGRWAGRQLKKGFWFLVRQVSEKLEKALRNLGDKGLLGLLKSWIESGIEILLAPIRFVSNLFGSAVDGIRKFGAMLGEMAVLIGQLAKGASRAVLTGIRKIAKVLLGVTGGTWSRLITALGWLMERLGWIVDKISRALDFIFDLLGSAIKAIWDAIKWLAEKIADLVSSIVGWVWEKIRSMLGYDTDGGGSGDGGGVMAWIKSKIKIATNWVESIISSVAGVVRWIAKLGPLQTLLNVFKFAETLGNSMTQAADAADEPDGPAKNRDILRDVVLPAIQGGIGAIRFIFKISGEGACTLINGFVAGVAGFMDALSSIPLVGGLFGWLATGARELGALASTAVSGVFSLIDSGLAMVSSWVEPILKTLVKIVSVALDAALHLPGLVLGTFWKIIPSWIRNPLKNFIVDKILKRIPILGQLITRLPDIWKKAVEIFKNFVVRVFSKGDLVGAAWGFFKDLLNLIGLPLRMIGEIISHALKTIGNILRHPFDFLVNLVRAIGRGLGNFIDHIWKNLVESLSDWMFGKLKLSNLRIPKEFSPAGLFDVVAQILKIDLESIIGLIRERKGETAANAVRTAINAGKKVLGWITTFIEKGPGALWADIQNHISNLWNLVLEKMQSFVLERIIAEGTKWLLTLLDISGIMPAIKTAIAVYHAVESFIENARRIFELIHAGFSAIADIAAGNLDRAAQLIEGGAVKLLTVAIDFVANQVGLGKIADKICEVIAAIRDKVRQALAKLIDMTLDPIIAAARSGVAAVKKGVASLREWWKARKEFSVENETHAVYLEGSDGGAVLMVSSTPATFTEYISALKIDSKKQSSKDKAVAVAKKIDKEIAAAAKDKTTAKTATPDDHATSISDLLEELSEHTRTLMSGSAWGKSSPTIYGAAVNSFGSSSTIERLTSDHPEGSPAAKAADNDHWDTLRLRRSPSGKSSYYVRGHLLNDNLGGPATWLNLTPITQETNNRSAESMLHNFERDVKTKVNTDKKAVSFSVTANYGQPSRAADIKLAKTKLSPTKATTVVAIMQKEALIPRSLDCIAHELKPDGTRGPKVADYRAENLIETDPADYKI